MKDTRREKKERIYLFTTSSTSTKLTKRNITTLRPTMILF